MKYTLKYTGEFKRSLKRCLKRGYDEKLYLHNAPPLTNSFRVVVPKFSLI